MIFTIYIQAYCWYWSFWVFLRVKAILTGSTKIIPAPGLSMGAGSSFVSRLKSLLKVDVIRLSEILSILYQLPVYEKDSIVSLMVWEAKHVCINGDLQYGCRCPTQWMLCHAGETTFFHRTYHTSFQYPAWLPAHHWHYVSTDPRTRISHQRFGPHSEIAMPDFTLILWDSSGRMCSCVICS